MKDANNECRASNKCELLLGTQQDADSKACQQAHLKMQSVDLYPNSPYSPWAMCCVTCDMAWHALYAASAVNPACISPFLNNAQTVATWTV